MEEPREVTAAGGGDACPHQSREHCLCFRVRESACDFRHLHLLIDPHSQLVSAPHSDTGSLPAPLSLFPVTFKNESKRSASKQGMSNKKTPGPLGGLCFQGGQEIRRAVRATSRDGVPSPHSLLQGRSDHPAPRGAKGCTQGTTSAWATSAVGETPLCSCTKSRDESFPPFL